MHTKCQHWIVVVQISCSQLSSAQCQERAQLLFSVVNSVVNLDAEQDSCWAAAQALLDVFLFIQVLPFEVCVCGGLHMQLCMNLLVCVFKSQR